MYPKLYFRKQLYQIKGTNTKL